MSWTKEQEQYLKRNYGRIPTYRVAKYVDRTPYAVNTKARRMGLKATTKADRLEMERLERLESQRAENKANIEKTKNLINSTLLRLGI